MVLYVNLNRGLCPRHGPTRRLRQIY
ncbi:hypothetical protein F383_25421 [Gossypium arboreum]|uniref:Uncharacterized protein n=1 Tax=Gossypium arboreum TaxID=29729 RepID=A0A0B0NVZ4_GOSAR|nr:hypothetical protein F383_25421 [Gossypium arboreum]